MRPPDSRVKLYAWWMGLAETAVLGAFMAQDLILFVLFFDLMLVPFYFLVGQWGGPDRVAATFKLVVYTLVGSLLMLAAAVATGVLAPGAEVTFSIQRLAAEQLGEGPQRWIFVAFALAFLIKMPAFPFHGWMPDGYRNMPLPVLAVFSAVLSKVAAYGFLRIVLPIFPDATQDFQLIMLLLALASVLYGSAQAFTQTNARLILGYSSMAQLGFITLGIFALGEAAGAQGALLQMVQHGLVVAPLFFIIVLLHERTGSDDIRDMGGVAFRAPVLSTLFLIVALATLAMPGSANFAGEFLILLGLFNAKLVIAIIAFTGVAMASVYMLRMFIRAMHNRVGEKTRVVRPEPRRRARARAARRRDHRVRDLSAAGAGQLAGERRAGRRRRGARRRRPAGGDAVNLFAAAAISGPKIDWMAISPLVALTGGRVHRADGGPAALALRAPRRWCRCSRS